MLHDRMSCSSMTANVQCGELSYARPFGLYAPSQPIGGRGRRCVTCHVHYGRHVIGSTWMISNYLHPSLSLTQHSAELMTDDGPLTAPDYNAMTHRTEDAPLFVTLGMFIIDEFLFMDEDGNTSGKTVAPQGSYVLVNFSDACELVIFYRSGAGHIPQLALVYGSLIHLTSAAMELIIFVVI